jgi:hypothetical protein
MSDPVAEAAAQLAEQAEQTQEVAEPGNAPAVAVASATAPATAEEAGTAAVGEIAAAHAEAEPVDISATTSVAAVESAATLGADELPNVASGAAEPTTEPDSAPSADGANTTLPTGASSAEPPLHMRIAMHLEAIYTMAREEVEAAPKEAAEQAQTVKTHIGDVLHRIRNGMAVAEGEMVQKLEALYRML